MMRVTWPAQPLCRMAECPLHAACQHQPRKGREEPSHTDTMQNGGILPLGSRLQTLTSDGLSQPGEKPEPQNQSAVRGLCRKCARVRGGTKPPHPDPQHRDVTTMTLPLPHPASPPCVAHALMELLLLKLGQTEQK